MGFEGDRAEQSEVKTVRRTVFRESVEDVMTVIHAAKNGAGGISQVKQTPFPPETPELTFRLSE